MRTSGNAVTFRIEEGMCCQIGCDGSLIPGDLVERFDDELLQEMLTTLPIDIRENFLLFKNTRNGWIFATDLWADESAMTPIFTTDHLSEN